MLDLVDLDQSAKLGWLVSFALADRSRLWLVRFTVGGHDVVGTIVEDRGLIGADKRQLLRVEVPVDVTYVAVYEVPAEELQAALLSPLFSDELIQQRYDKFRRLGAFLEKVRTVADGRWSSMALWS